MCCEDDVVFVFDMVDICFVEVCEVLLFFEDDWIGFWKFRKWGFGFNFIFVRKWNYNMG